MSEKHSPDSLKYQWRIIGLVLRSEWATGLDKSIAFEIVDNYRKDHGNSRASLSYLVTATGADRKSVIASTRRLVENGPFSVARQGAGTRPTEYNIDFDLVRENASSGAGTTTELEHSSGGVGATTGGGVDTTTSGSSSGAGTTESVLPVAAYKAGVQDRMIDPPPPAAPLPVGLTATGAGSVGDGFEELWKAYGHRQKKADARAAYIKAAPSADLHIRMVDAARAWFSAWAAQGKADAPRFTLAKWIEREEYECDPPSAFKAKERKTAKPVAGTADVKEDRPNKPDFSAHPDRPSTGTIERVETSVDDEDGARLLQITYRTHDDETVEQLIVYESSDRREQECGQAELESLLAATGVASIGDDPGCLVGRPVDLMLSFDGKFVSCSEPWVPAPKTVRNAPSWKDVMANTPWGGWAKKLGTSTDEDEAA